MTVGWARFAAAALALAAPAAAAEDPYLPARLEMVRVVEEIAAGVGGGDVPRVLDPRVLDAMRAVPRHEFVPTPERAHAYDDRPLPIGHGQTISQPYIVALMTDLLAVEPGDAVFELGTGSGYQAAVLAELGARVHTVEIVAPLAAAAAERLARLGYGGVAARAGDGYDGWPEHAPFDGIVVTAGADTIPPPLIEQLKPGGRMVIPVGRGVFGQDLTLVEKSASGEISKRVVLPVAFVPFMGEHGKGRSRSVRKRRTRQKSGDA